MKVEVSILTSQKLSKFHHSFVVCTFHRIKGEIYCTHALELFPNVRWIHAKKLSWFLEIRKITIENSWHWKWKSLIFITRFRFLAFAMAPYISNDLILRTYTLKWKTPSWQEKITNRLQFYSCSALHSFGLDFNRSLWAIYFWKG